jgi:hypothetical protein
MTEPLAYPSCTVTYSTSIFHLAKSPLGLLGERWHVYHRCDRCYDRVEPDQLISHAQEHEPNSVGS